MGLAEDFIPIVIFIIVGLMFPMVMVFVSSLIGRQKKPEPGKYLTYECGVIPTGSAWMQHNVEYYMYALLFVVFDVETVFLYPWAVVFKKIGIFATIDVIIFICVLAFGLVYAWKKGVLEWMNGGASWR